MTKSNRTDYDVGKGKPPVHSQFQPGQSGNPSGKKKGTLSLKAVWEKALQQEITYTENGELKTMTMYEAVCKQLVNQGAKGNLKAIDMVLNRAERLLDADPEVAVEMPEEDREILRRVSSDPQLLRQMMGAQERRQGPDPSGSYEGGDD